MTRRGLWRIQFCDQGLLEEPERDESVRFTVVAPTVDFAIRAGRKMYDKSVEDGTYYEGRVVVSAVLIGMESD